MSTNVTFHSREKHVTHMTWRGAWRGRQDGGYAGEAVCDSQGQPHLQQYTTIASLLNPWTA